MNEVFKDQPITVPANLVVAILQYLGNKPAGETAFLLMGLQNATLAQLQAIETADNQPQEVLAEAPQE
jgi:hypothetical protein